ncbi:hypothetical protein L7G72_09200 [Xenorhabdus bovienii]|uniref:hypothetical protein n=1 Tax=Xenorhabdus bovienii TaxID=40576 RepID=UPI001EDF643F|nr:hypothetical protein [Xenorhabdus bovienii]MCG3462023.1 hypothetical protein [Xenorhabdus bovienii]
MSKAWTLYLTLVALAFGAGWRVNHYYRDSVELNITRAAAKTGEKIRQELQAISSTSARQLEEKLEGIAHAAPREIRTEVVKPVFAAVCVSPEFVRMYNDTADSIERTLSGKLTDKMSGHITETDRNDRK